MLFNRNITNYCCKNLACSFGINIKWLNVASLGKHTFVCYISLPTFLHWLNIIVQILEFKGLISQN